LVPAHIPRQNAKIAGFLGQQNALPALFGGAEGGKERERVKLRCEVTTFF
jgi:hypothetical protein